MFELFHLDQSLFLFIRIWNVVPPFDGGVGVSQSAFVQRSGLLPSLGLGVGKGDVKAALSLGQEENRRIKIVFRRHTNDLFT